MAANDDAFMTVSRLQGSADEVSEILEDKMVAKGVPSRNNPQGRGS